MWASLGLMLTWAGIATFTNSFPFDLLFSLVLFLIPGPWLLYTAAALVVNYTEFRIENGELLIRHMPIPWRGNKAIPVMDVRRFFVFTRREESGEVSEGPLTCDVAVIKNGDIIMVASGVNHEIAIAIVRAGQQILGKPNQIDTESLEAVFKQDRSRLR